MKVCPKCGYERRLVEAAPAWQCPNCGIAYVKWRPSTPAVGKEPSASDIVVEFQSRRSVTWRAIRPWIAAIAAAFAILILVGPEGCRQPTSWLGLAIADGLMVLFLFSMGRILFVVYKHYRCPACDEVPTDPNGRVNYMDPTQCPKCGVLLK